MTIEFKQDIESQKSLVRDFVEEALQRPSVEWRFRGAAKRFAGKLSTIPDRVHDSINNETLHRYCGDLSIEVASALRKKGIKAEGHGSSESIYGCHMFIVVPGDLQEIIVEPTIGQIIKGHNHVFVGTRDELRDLVFNQTGEGKLYRPIYFRCINEDERTLDRLFHEMWGDQSYNTWPID